MEDRREVKSVELPEKQKDEEIRTRVRKRILQTRSD